jgi:hypothetical protein
MTERPDHQDLPDSPDLSGGGSSRQLDIPPEIHLPSVDYGTYDGPRLTPPLHAQCGWCLTEQCQPNSRNGSHGCPVWLLSPGSPADMRHNDRVPCIHVCNPEKEAYLDSVFGPGWRDRTRRPKHLPDADEPSSVGAPISPFGQRNDIGDHMTETQASDEPMAVAVPDPFREDTPEEAKARHDAVLGSDDTPTEDEAEQAEAEATEPDAQPAGDAAETKVRAERTDLEGDVKAVTDDFTTGAFKIEEGEALTPHAIAKEIGKRRGAEKPPSTGAVSAAFDRWKKIGFAVIEEKPKRFVDYTEEGRANGLSAMKEQAAAAKKAAKGS